MILQIRHLPGSDPAQFQVLNPDPNNIQMSAVTDEVPDPVGYPVAGWPDKTLLPGLTWYLERFLDYPFDPETAHAEMVQKALRRWGEEAFEALFGGRRVGGWFDRATEKTYADLHLQVVSNEPAVLAWPWEALFDRQSGCFLAQSCQVEHRLDQLRDPPKLDKLPKDRVNILLVIARPYERDVRFRSVARALVEWADRPEVPANVHVLRPPTFDRLRAHLHERPGFYHLLHFDGHGAYGDGEPAAAGRHTFQAAQGRIILEKDDGGPDPIAAETLSDLLRESAVPAVVLNACQSAMLDERADDPFASVAAALLRAGMRSVTAMSYSLYVSGAQQFLPAFYQRLFEHGRLPDAVRAGRQQMRSRRQRVCARGTFPLDDWLVPVLYQNDPIDFAFVKKVRPKDKAATELPAEARDEHNPYGFLGRDSALLELERAMRRPPAGILISGLGGVGKTTLARGLLHWLGQSGGLGEGVFWFGFAEIRSAEYVLNRVGEALFGGNFAAAAVGDKLEALTNACRQRRLLVVWDNFESARGIAGTAVSANLPTADCDLLRNFLVRLRGGATKVLITSRSAEDWLGTENRYLLPLGGLDGEERWELANAILGELGQKVNRTDPALDGLMKLLNGHPLAMRVSLPRLEHSSPATLLQALRENAETLWPNAADENEARLFATLRFVTDALPPAWQPLLIPIAQHEGFVDAVLLEHMAGQVDPGWTPAIIDGCLSALANAGLLRSVGPGLYEMHPAVAGFLHVTMGSDPAGGGNELWLRAFVDVMARFANQYGQRDVHVQRRLSTLFGGTFYNARGLAACLQMNTEYAALTQSLATYAQINLSYPVAVRLLQEFADNRQQVGDEEGLAIALHHLGMIVQERRDLDAAEQLYRKSLAISERLGNESSAAATFNQLGWVASQRGDLDEAEQCFRKSLAVSERLGIHSHAASTYHQMGWVAQLRRDLDSAEQWYRKSLAIGERLGDEPRAIGICHQLGIVAQERGDLDGAERWYRKSLAMSERLGDDQGAAVTYHQLGWVAHQRRDWDGAEGWYRKSLAISERLGIDSHAASSYHQLGGVAEERRDWDAAERWYRKSLATSERLGDEPGAARTYHQLGLVAEARRDWDAAEASYRKALSVFESFNDPHNAAIVIRSLARLAELRQGSL